MTGKRHRLVSILGLVAIDALILLSWTGEWFVVVAAGTEIRVSGDVAAGGLAALAVAGFALAGALAIAGRVFRVALGALQVLIGLTAVLQCVISIADPVAAAENAITMATGIDGASSVAAAVSAVSMSAWPWFALVLSIASTIGGIVVLAGNRRWPVATRKYQATGYTDAKDQATPLGDWDALSEGDDPTTR